MKKIIINNGVAGSGKTYRLVNQAASCGKRVMIVTLTNAARMEIEERLDAMEATNVFVRTFHSLAIEAIHRLTGSANIEDVAQPKETSMRSWNLYRSVNIRHAPHIALELAAKHARRGEFVFSDLDEILVDEYQDQSRSDFELLKNVFSGVIRIYGDPLQTLFAFRGAEPKAWEVLEDGKYAPYTRWLPIYEEPVKQSRRVPRSTLELFEPLGLDGVELWPCENGGESAIEAKDGWTVESWAKRNVTASQGATTALIARYNETLRDIIFDNDLYPVFPDARKEISDIRIGLAEQRGDKEETDRKLRRLGELQAKEKIFAHPADPGRNYHITTVHSAKGREWDDVIYFRGDKKEEPNIDYVAITRSRKRLTLVR